MHSCIGCTCSRDDAAKMRHIHEKFFSTLSRDSKLIRVLCWLYLCLCWSYINNLRKEEGITIFFTTHYMEEAENMADKIAIMDHGNIIKEGNVESLLKLTKTDTLEKAFLALTGTEIRDEDASGTDRMRDHRRMRGR